MDSVQIGDVTITSIVERDGPWRKPSALLLNYDPVIGERHLKSLPPFVHDPENGLIVITYQTFVVRTPRHTILVDTCVGEDKGYAAPMDFPKAPWLAGFRSLGLRFDDIDYVFCTHLHIDHTGWNTKLVGGRWVPTFPKAKYVFHAKEYAFWEAANARGQEYPGGSGGVWRMNCEPVVASGQALLVDDDFALDDTVTLTPTPGHSFHHCCVNICSRSVRAVITGDLMHHVLQVCEPDWSTTFDIDPAQAARSRRSFFGAVADTGTLLLPVHFPSPTAGRIGADGGGFRYHFSGG